MNNLPQNILYVENSSEIGGANRSLLLILDHLDRTRFIPFVIVPSSGPMVEELVKRGIPHRIISRAQPTKIWPFPFFRAVRMYIDIMQEQKIDLVHVNDIATYLWIGAALNKYPLLPTMCHVRFPYSRVGLAYLAKRTRWPDVLVYNSHAMEHELGNIADEYMPGVKKSVLHNALDTDFFCPVVFSDSCKKEFGIDQKTPVISIVANFTPAKDHETFLRMAKLVRRSIHNALFVLAGTDVLRSGKRENELKKFAVELGIAEATRFIGFVDDIRSVIAASDVVVCTSVVETFGRCVMEAMSCGKPVVASRVGGIPEIIISKQVGELVESGDDAGFAEAIVRYLLDENLSRQTASCARQHVMKHFGVGSHITKLNELYRGIMAEGVK